MESNGLRAWMALRRRKRRGFSIDVLVKSRIIWQFFDGHATHKLRLPFPRGDRAFKL
jgi:hypothetical protein